MFWGEIEKNLLSEGATVRIHSKPYRLELTMLDREPANQLWKLRNDIAQVAKTYNLPNEIIISIPDERLFHFQATTIPSFTIANQHITLTMPDQPQNLQDLADRTRRHRALLEAAAFNTVGATLHDANPKTGYQYLDVISPIPQRQNRPTVELIGQPCTIVDPRIGEPRLHAIERALKHGQAETYKYKYEDEMGLWEFIVKVAPLYGSGEVLTVVHDAASWQRPYWENKIFGAPEQ